MTTRERDYVLGTHDDEIARLGLPHSVWRARSPRGVAPDSSAATR
jgi:hypothetical protein